MRFLVMALALVAGLVYVRRTGDPSLRRERMRPGGPTIDGRVHLGIRVSGLTMLVVVALDTLGLHWSDSVPPRLEWLGAAVVVAAIALLAWSVSTNRFFSSAVRIQEDRGHRVITGGPYAYVRHPGYVAMMSLIPGFAVAAGSWAGLGVGAIFASFVVRRAAIEDRFLREHLDGYAAYAASVRYRILPGIW